MLNSEIKFKPHVNKKEYIFLPLHCYSSHWSASKQADKKVDQKVFNSCHRASKMVTFGTWADQLTQHYEDIAKFSWGDVME